MKLDIISKNYTPSNRLIEVLEKKLDKLDKYFPNEPSARVVMKGEKKGEVLEISINYQGTLLRAEVRDEHIYDCIDVALPKLEKQLVKHRGTLVRLTRTELRRTGHISGKWGWRPIL